MLALVTPMGPGGLRVDPIHRVVPDLALDAAVERRRAGFAEVVDVRRTGRAASATRSARGWPTAGAGRFLVTDGAPAGPPAPADRRAAGRRCPTEAPPAWRGLDVVLAHHGLIDQLWHRPDEPESVRHRPRRRRGTADGRGARAGIALLLRAPSPGDVAAVARAGARMPRKSTLFVPKPRTGLVLRPLEG